MKPNFALSLSFEGIRLLHRAENGWLLVGEVALDDADLIGKLAELRDIATQIQGTPVRCKVLVPNDQIKFMSLDDPMASYDDVAAALDGATPYPVSDLSFDFCKTSDATLIAAVARETLAEAETFAVDNGFMPMSFVAVPSEGDFVGEPFLGRSTVAIAAGETIEREATPVVVSGVFELPEPEPEPEPESTVTLDTFEVPDDVMVDEVEDEVAPDALPPVEEAEEVDLPLFQSRSQVSAPTPPRVEASEPAPEIATDAEAAPLFASRNRVAAPEVTPELKVGTKPTEASAPTPQLDAETKPASAPAAPMPSPAPTPEATMVTKAEEKPSALTTILGVFAAIGGAVLAVFSTLYKLWKKRRDKKALEKVTVAETTDASTGNAPNEKAQMTIFGARRKVEQKARKKPRFLGLILTLILIFFLGLVALWSTTLEDGIAGLFGFGKEDAVVAETPVDTPADDPAEMPSSDDERDEDRAITALDDGTMPEDLLPPEALPRPIGTVLTPAEAQRIYAATGIWQRAARLPLIPRTESADNVRIAAIDPVTLGTDAVALPVAVQPDLSLPLQLPPPPSGTVYPRDERGFILATPEGTTLPTGVVIYARSNGPAPVSRPTSITPRVPEVEAPEPTEIVTAGGVSLASLRPRLRPSGFAEDIERSQLGGRTSVELAGLRPRLRPETLVVPEPVSPEVVAAALAAVNPLQSATALAVASAPAPATRPRNFDRVVSAARSAPAPAVAAPAVVAPTGPVPGGVAAAATENNVLNLRKIALLGISGSSNSRTAVVRLANGRIVTVRVGDRLDGGRVSAIDTSGLTYVKSGRNYGLPMP